MNLAFIATKRNKRIEVILEGNFLLFSKDEIFSSAIIAKNKYERLKKEYKESNFKIEIIASSEKRKELKKERKRMIEAARLKADTEKLRRQIIMRRRVRLTDEKN